MRILMVWFVAAGLIFIITLGWYLSQPIVMGIAASIDTSSDPTATNVKTAVQYGNILWGPILILVILLWAIISSQKRDVESQIYG